ncbi:kinase-like domain-containing protein [Rhizoctonia solani]|nr:kinase-like domain-containing protein [Rhizoctonia solani]
MAENSPSEGRTAGVGDFEERNSVVISSSMPISELVTRLSRHGCQDITNQLDLSKFSRTAVSTGGFGDVYHGTLQDGTQVAVKCLRLLVGVDDESGKKQLKRAARELYVWSKCKHPNVLELFGVARYNDRVAMVSPWMENENLTWYLTRYPDADRHHLCASVADAIAFLRQNGVVHGDIKGANILVSRDHVPKLTDFGSSAVNKCTLEFTATTSSPSMTLRWTAPEIFLGETNHTFEGDVYAFGMTILEAFTGSVPYEGLLDVAVMRNLMARVLPVRPEKQFPIGNRQADLLWNLMTRCWEGEPQKRPSALHVRDEMKSIIAARPLGTSSPSTEVQKIAIPITVSIDMSTEQIIQCLIAHGARGITHEVEKSMIWWAPSWEHTFDREYYTEEGLALLRDGTKVSLRRATKSRPYFYHGASEDILPNLHTAYEAYVLSRCKHANIQGIAGVASIENTLVMSSLNPVIQYQCLRQVLSSKSDNLPRCKVSTQIADAISYLHRNQITHGDINTYNIRVSSDYNAQLGGFHNSVAHKPSLQFPLRQSTILDGSHASAGDQYYGVLIKESAYEVDIFAFGKTVLDILTWGQSVYGDVDRRLRPERFIPTNSDDGDRLWSLIQECLSHRPETRPWAADVQYIMATITDEGLQERIQEDQRP